MYVSASPALEARYARSKPHSRIKASGTIAGFKFAQRKAFDVAGVLAHAPYSFGRYQLDAFGSLRIQDQLMRAMSQHLQIVSFSQFDRVWQQQAAQDASITYKTPKMECQSKDVPGP